jgi:hypothetical protein
VSVARGGEFVAAAVRFAGLLALAIAVIAAVALLFTLLGTASFRRAGALGCYGIGSILLVSGFFIGNRGPVRPSDAGRSLVPMPFGASRRLRLATREEQEESLNLGAIVVALGLALIACGIAVDEANELV